jgi:hypothetical protein
MTFLADAVLAAVCFAACCVIAHEVGRVACDLWRELQ